ncbi:unnamed protein product [Rotaria sp. Silwood1]|nr:unnamed protein product [Rotaria sp. Silwood1]
MVDVLHSFVDVNQRFNQLAFDSLYIHDLNMTTIMDISSLYDQTSLIDPKVLSRICEKILPQIHDQIYKLTVEEYSINQILLASNYPKIYSLSLVNFQEVIFYQYLMDNLILRNLIKQITHLNIDIKETTEHCSEIGSKIFALILSLFDCLYLLDGPLICLSTLIINVSSTFCPLQYINPTVRRSDSTYIDGIQLYDQFLIYMTQLKKFTFSIKTMVLFRTVKVELQSNEDIQRSFIGRGYQQVASYVHPNAFSCDGKCHIYSLPYDFEYFFNLDNSFQGGMFNKVRQLKMSDAIPFEDNLFKLISQNFPFLEFLYISNDYPQKHNQHSSTSIIFPYLKFLDLKWAHIDYAELFLLKKNMHLSRLSNLFMKYESLITITNNFTNDATQFNFGNFHLHITAPFTSTFIAYHETATQPISKSPSKNESYTKQRYFQRLQKSLVRHRSRSSFYSSSNSPSSSRNRSRSHRQVKSPSRYNCSQRYSSFYQNR